MLSIERVEWSEIRAAIALPKRVPGASTARWVLIPTAIAQLLTMHLSNAISNSPRSLTYTPYPPPPAIHDMKLAAPTALLVSLLSLGVSAWSAYKADVNTKLAYRPYAIAAPMFDDSGNKHGIYLSNAGLGPATINSMTVTVDGRIY